MKPYLRAIKRAGREWWWSERGRSLLHGKDPSRNRKLTVKNPGVEKFLIFLVGYISFIGLLPSLHT